MGFRLRLPAIAKPDSHFHFAGTSPDKIFVASDNKVRAFNKKGKQFLTFDSNLTEPIRSMFVCGNDLILCGNHVYNHYRDCKDIGTYLCGDNIVDVVVLFSSGVRQGNYGWEDAEKVFVSDQ